LPSLAKDWGSYFSNIMTREEIDKIMEGLKWTIWPEPPKGGQQVNWYPRGIKLTHPDFSEVEICMSAFRTQMENIGMARMMFELFLISLPS